MKQIQSVSLLCLYTNTQEDVVCQQMLITNSDNSNVTYDKHNNIFILQILHFFLLAELMF